VSRHPDGGFTVIQPPGAKSTAPDVRSDAPIRVRARRCERHQRWQMIENSGNEGTTYFRKTIVARRIRQKVLPMMPEAEVKVAPAASLVGKNLGQERGLEPVMQRHRVNGIAEGKLPVGSRQRYLLQLQKQPGYKNSKYSFHSHASTRL
jgi:hypothetical protein